MRKLVIFLILALTLVSLSAVSAAENITGVAESDGGDILAEDNSVVDDLNDSEISAKPTTGYESFSTEFTVTLTSNGTALASKPVSININKIDYKRTTDSNGQAKVNVKLAKGTYKATFAFLGDEIYSPSNGTSTITVKDPVKTVFKVADKDINYRQGSKSVFIVRLLTSSGAAVKNQQVTIVANGKSHKAVTDSRGYAQAFLSLKKGTRKVSYSFKANSPYLSSKGYTYIKVKASLPKGNGYWMWGSDMKSVNLKTLKSKGTKHIFLHSYAINVFGKKTVTSWISNANKYGMKVHIWMQVFYDGKWHVPVGKDGIYKYSYMNKKIELAKSYAKIKGVAGVHLDYVRYAGTAYNYDYSVKAINYFVKKVCVEVRKVQPNCIISASVMPEPGALEYYYGQDVPTMSKYLDVIIPMAYKGNYGKTTSWIQYVTNALVFDSNGAQIWTGLQTYKSESNPKPLSYSQLLKDAQAAKSGGAKGVLLFRMGLTKLLDFNKV